MRIENKGLTVKQKTFFIWCMEQLIKDAASLISQFNAELAECFINQPFRRVDLAHAFAAGFAKNEGDDVNANAALVLRVAYHDRAARQSGVG